FVASGCLEPGTGRYAIEASGQNLRPNVIKLPGDVSLTGTFQLQGHGDGTLKDPVFSARIHGSEVRIGAVPVGELEAKVDAAGQRATALLAMPALNAQVTSTIAMEGAWPFELKLDSRNTHLETNPVST